MKRFSLKVIIVIAGIFLLLLFFLVFFFFQFPKEKIIEEEIIPEERIVLAESQIPDISFNLKDKEELERVLLEFGFWEKAGLFGFGEYRTVKPKKLIIYLTDQEQPWFPAIFEEKVLYSVGTSFDEENYNLFLYIEPLIIKELEEVILSQAADWLFFRNLYRLTHPEEEPEVGVTLEKTKAFKLFTKYREKEESTFFEIKKQ